MLVFVPPVSATADSPGEMSGAIARLHAENATPRRRMVNRLAMPL